MANLISLIIGIVSLPLVLLAFFPLLGWANWFILPLPVIGAAIGAMSDKTTGRNLNLVLVGVGLLRLALTGGTI